MMIRVYIAYYIYIYTHKIYSDMFDHFSMSGWCNLSFDIQKQNTEDWLENQRPVHQSFLNGGGFYKDHVHFTS